ncbi:MAG: hypothetical protein M3Q78_12005 [Acidobacteriota bacterium]|nr:hypothetical protein [Acidobacteriota bacterium]
MKITKTFVSVFLVTFLIGYVFVPATKKEVTISFETATKLLETLPSPIETKSEIEILEENNDWEDRDESKFKIKLLETGEDFNDDDVVAKNGETWLGLFKEKENYFLRPTRIKISRIRVKTDDGENRKVKTRKSIKVSDQIKPLFLLKNFNASKEKSHITTLFQGMTWSDILEHKEHPNFNSYEMLTKLNKSFVGNYKIGINEYTLRVIKAKNKNNAEILALILEGEGKRQIIHTVQTKESFDVGSLYWVGDLDSDGKPDFYLDLYYSDYILEQTLFLSSKAENGKLIKAVASFVTYSNC